MTNNDIMTNQPVSAQNTDQKQVSGGMGSEQKVKQSLPSKILGGLSWWVSSMTGKASVKKQTQVAVNAAPVKSNPAVPANGVQNQISNTDDSVSRDLEQARKIVGKLSGAVSKAVTPVVAKGVSSSEKTAAKFLKKDNKFLKIILRLFIILIFLMIAVFVGLKLFQSGAVVVKPPVKPSPNILSITLTVTPTPVVYNPMKPSVYADDLVVLKLEQDINILTREIAGTNIKETQLNPPSLDFNISF